ncbi:MAG: hypothetical protein HY286_05360 [Planctomycetes bacterium]|nr:hypothetical protein [Planctomycetota bacterium]
MLNEYPRQDHIRWLGPPSIADASGKIVRNDLLPSDMICIFRPGFMREHLIINEGGEIDATLRPMPRLEITRRGHDEPRSAVLFSPGREGGVEKIFIYTYGPSWRFEWVEVDPSMIREFMDERIEVDGLATEPSQVVVLRKNRPAARAGFITRPPKNDAAFDAFAYECSGYGEGCEDMNIEVLSCDGVAISGAAVTLFEITGETTCGTTFAGSLESPLLNSFPIDVDRRAGLSLTLFTNERGICVVPGLLTSVFDACSVEAPDGTLRMARRHRFVGDSRDWIININSASTITEMATVHGSRSPVEVANLEVNECQPALIRGTLTYKGAAVAGALVTLIANNQHSSGRTMAEMPVSHDVRTAVTSPEGIFVFEGNLGDSVRIVAETQKLIHTFDLSIPASRKLECNLKIGLTTIRGTAVDPRGRPLAVAGRTWKRDRWLESSDHFEQDPATGKFILKDLFAEEHTVAFFDPTGRRANVEMDASTIQGNAELGNIIFPDRTSLTIALYRSGNLFDDTRFDVRDAEHDNKWMDSSAFGNDGERFAVAPGGHYRIKTPPNPRMTARATLQIGRAAEAPLKLEELPHGEGADVPYQIDITIPKDAESVFVKIYYAG